MHEGQQKREWDITSCLMALIANCHRDSKKKPFKPEQFNPFAKRNQNAIPVTKENIGILKNLFVRNFGKAKSKKQ